MSKNIGQIRYSGSGCVDTETFKVGYHSTSLDAGVSNFKDVIITPSKQFSKNKDYYVKLAIPQDMNYDLTLNIKLIKKNNGTNQVYQFLKKVTVLRGGAATNVYNVALYEKSNGQIAAMIPHNYQTGITTKLDELYYDKDDINKDSQKYYLGTGLMNGYLRTDKVNLLSVVASWKQESSTNFGIFELVFRPVESGFTDMLLEIVREPIDYDIQRTTSNGIEYGRKININDMQISIYSLRNLVDKIFQNGQLERIGVWSHPGLLMAINGEEIKVGPSGFYEIDVLPITSLGIVAPDNNFNNNFTVDYTFDIDAITKAKEE